MTPTQAPSCEYCEIFKDTFFTEHLRANASGSWIWKHFPVLTILCKKNNETATLRNIDRDCYQLPGNGTLMCKTFYLLNFVLFHWISFIQIVPLDILLKVICFVIEIKRYSLPSLWEILVMVQVVLISW